MCAWNCLNPSYADGERDDASVRKMIGFSRLWGYGGFALFNVLSLRTTYPSVLLTHPEPRGPQTASWIAERCREISCDPPIVAWGAIHPRFAEVAADLLRALGPTRCLGYTKGQQPRHPLRLAYATPLQKCTFTSSSTAAVDSPVINHKDPKK